MKSATGKQERPSNFGYPALHFADKPPDQCRWSNLGTHAPPRSPALRDPISRL